MDLGTSDKELQLPQGEKMVPSLVRGLPTLSNEADS